MNETEKRRIQLLEEARKNHLSGRQTQRTRRQEGHGATQYGRAYLPPAVHPRYRTPYRKLYGQEEEETLRSSFGLRLVISILIFTVFLAAQYKEETFGPVSADTIISEIKKEPFVEFLPEK